MAAVVLLGNPNVGKSALFGALTGTYVTVSNYPGTTVEVTRGMATIGAMRCAVIDTPGATSLVPGSEDERVTRDILLSAETGPVVVVGDAKNLERTLALVVQLGETGRPAVVCLNMADEAHARGIAIDTRALAERLGCPVVSTVAVSGEGVDGLRRALEGARPVAVHVEYPAPVERAIRAIAHQLVASPHTRAIALMALCGDDAVLEGVEMREGAASRQAIETERCRAAVAVADPLPWAIGQARRRVAASLAASVAHRARPAAGASLHGTARRRLERATTHPVWGHFVLAGVLFAAYQFVGVFGAGTLVDLLEDGLFGGFINPTLTAVLERTLPWAFARDLLVGPYGIVTMALTYSLALVLPIVGTFFVAFGLLEDSGYLPRLAVMLDRLFKKIGLNGKAVLPMVLGLGCDTMATLTTRILETRRERLIVIVLLALGVPCSAQLTVVLAMLGGLSPWAAAVWLAVVAGSIVLVGRLAARILPGRSSPFVLELPPLRLPRPGNIAVKTLARLEWYLKEAVPLFVLGTLVLFAADRLHLLGGLQRVAAPVLTGLLGLPGETGEAFVVGFLRRDFGAAGLYRLAEQGRLSPAQVLVATVTITLFIPCIANFFMIVKERGWRTALAVAAFVFPYAVGVGALLNAALPYLPVSLR
jgi:ferrous iron transport protein B